MLGLANFVAYTIGYVFIGGDAPLHGRVVAETGPDGRAAPRYYINVAGRDEPVSRGTWLYSAIHSTSVWPTVGAVMLAMLTLAKDRIVSSMRSSMLRGRTLMTILATLIGFITVVMTAWFVLHMVRQLGQPPLAAGPAGPGACLIGSAVRAWL